MRAWMLRDGRWSVMVAAAALAAWELPVPTYAQPAPEYDTEASQEAEARHDAVETEPPAPAPAPAPAAADVARELYRLQQARGGSIVPDWSDLQRGPAPQDDARPTWSPHRPVVAEAYERTPPINPTQLGPEAPPSERSSALREGAPLPPPPGVYGPPPTPHYVQPPVPRYGPPGAPLPVERPGPSRIEALRDTAAQLDQAANRLEGLDLYEQADRLRETAQQLRLAAREMRERG